MTSAVAIATALLAASLGLGATYLVRAARHEPVRPVLAPASGEHYGDAAGADDEVDVAPASP